MKQIDYYFWINSDWAYLGASRLLEIAARHGARINYMPVDLPHVYARTGGILLSERSPERQAYRLTELKRWCQRLDLHINFKPRFMCPNGDLASCVVIAAKRRGWRTGDLVNAILHAQWKLDQDISSPETLRGIARNLELYPDILLHDAQSAEVQAEYVQYTQAAIEAGVFGSPAYVYQGELFWGQDRLDFLEQAIAAA
jgi:2-hydroxychromene-2-carboxylate isomerase